MNTHEATAALKAHAATELQPLAQLGMLLGSAIDLEARGERAESARVLWCGLEHGFGLLQRLANVVARLALEQGQAVQQQAEPRPAARPGPPA